MSLNISYLPVAKKRSFKADYTSTAISQIDELFPSRTITAADSTRIAALGIAGQYRELWKEIGELVDKYESIQIFVE